MANTPKERQIWILEELKSNPIITYSQLFAKYFPKFAKSKVTFDKDWLKSNSEFKEYQIKANKAKDDASIAEEVNTLKKGLKSKTERLLILQNQVDMTLIDLENDDLKPHEVVAFRRLIKELQSEISKIEGDYAPAKSDITSNGEAITKTTISITLPDGKELTDFTLD